MNANLDKFWSFSLTLYEAPGVMESCLELQNQHNFDVVQVVQWLLVMEVPLIRATIHSVSFMQAIRLYSKSCARSNYHSGASSLLLSSSRFRVFP